MGDNLKSVAKTEIYMKIQDLIFLIVLIILLYKRNPRYFVYAGLICFAISMPLFYQWVFFTAQKLIGYGFIFNLIAILGYAI